MRELQRLAPLPSSHFRFPSAQRQIGSGMTNKKKSGASRAKAKATKDATAAQAGPDATTFTNGEAKSNGRDSASASSTGEASEPETDEEQEAEDEQQKQQKAEAQAEALKNQGTAAYKSKSYTQAVEHYTAAISALPTYVSAIFNRAAAYMALKQFSKALEDCQTTAALQGQPPQPKTLARLGKCQLALGLVDQAAQSLQQARAAPGLENATLNAVLADLAKLDRIQNHLKSIQKAKADKSWSLVQFGLDAASKEVESEPLAWKLLRVEALIMRNKFDEASFLAT